MEAYFSPHGGCTEAVIRAIAGAERRVFVQAYSFTSGPICLALRRAHSRGMRVEVLIDKGEAFDRGSVVPALLAWGIIVRAEMSGGLGHNKIVLVDDSLVLTGSFNFTDNAEEHNQENLLVIDNVNLFAQFLRNWDKCNAGAMLLEALPATISFPSNLSFPPAPESTA